MPDLTSDHDQRPEGHAVTRSTVTCSDCDPEGRGRWALGPPRLTSSRADEEAALVRRMLVALTEQRAIDSAYFVEAPYEPWTAEAVREYLGLERSPAETEGADRVEGRVNQIRTWRDLEACTARPDCRSSLHLSFCPKRRLCEPEAGAAT